ncbi:MAG: acyltransferase [Pseudomonadota bacterium]
MKTTKQRAARMQNQQIPALDGLRGIAALIVVISHLSNQVDFRYTGFGAGQIGVMIFFALSGFLMCHVTHNVQLSPASAWNFFVKRFARVVPLFVFVVLFSYFTYGRQIFGVTFQFYGMGDWDTVLHHLTLRKGYSVLWTIPVELFFYALFPVYWAISSRGWAVWAVLALLIIQVLFVIPWYEALSEQHDDAVPTFLRLFSRLQYFLVGILAYRFCRSEMKNLDAVFIFSASLILLCYPQIYKSLTDTPAMVWRNESLMLLVFLLLLSASNSSLANKVLGGPVMRHLGDISYSVYLTHVPVMLVVTQLVDTGTPVLFVSLVLAGTLAVSEVTFRFLEKPSRRAITNRTLKAGARRLPAQSDRPV